MDVTKEAINYSVSRKRYGVADVGPDEDSVAGSYLSSGALPFLRPLFPLSPSLGCGPLASTRTIKIKLLRVDFEPEKLC